VSTDKTAIHKCISLCTDKNTGSITPTDHIKRCEVHNSSLMSAGFSVSIFKTIGPITAVQGVLIKLWAA
jgi:hypothetical protein